MTYIIKGDPVTKKNSGRIVRYGQRAAIRPSKQYEAYSKDAIKQLQAQKRPSEPLSEPITVKTTYYMRTRRRVDIANLLNATHDILQDAGIIADDCRDIIASVDGSRVYYDKENPRAEITILPYKEAYEPFKQKETKQL